MKIRKRNKLVCGVGINDADYAVIHSINGKQVRCLFYRAWKSMLERCYSAKFQAKNPTYIGCSVCEEWLTFSNFKKWMEAQPFEGKQLDKDILISGNKVYSPEACVFISRQVNTLLCDSGASRGELKQGVCFVSDMGKFQARVSIHGRRKHLGCRNTGSEAYALYVAAKADHIREVADTQEPRVKSALYARAVELENTLKTED